MPAVIEGGNQLLGAGPLFSTCIPLGDPQQGIARRSISSLGHFERHQIA